MPQQRILLTEDAGLRLEKVRFQGGTSSWGPVYHAPDRRLVLPGNSSVLLRSGDQALWADELTAFCVEALVAYQVRPDDPCAARDNVVLSGAADARMLKPLEGWLLPPRALLCLRLRCRAARTGVELASIARQVASWSPLPEHAPEPLAVARQVLRSSARASLAELGDRVRLSEFQIARMFRRHLGCSPHQYRLRLRVANAILKLEEGERDLAGMAHELGFSSQSHLGAIFLRETGMTPGTARRAFEKAGTAGF